MKTYRSRTSVSAVQWFPGVEVADAGLVETLPRTWEDDIVRAFVDITAGDQSGERGVLCPGCWYVVTRQGERKIMEDKAFREEYEVLDDQGGEKEQTNAN